MKGPAKPDKSKKSPVQQKPVAAAAVKKPAPKPAAKSSPKSR